MADPMTPSPATPTSGCPVTLTYLLNEMLY
jgi:hypothetical protein